MVSLAVYSVGLSTPAVAIAVCHIELKGAVSDSVGMIFSGAVTWC